MKKFFSSALVAFLFLFLQRSHAGILIEPYVGHDDGALLTKYNYSPDERKDTATGVGYGLRLGYKFAMSWVALDYTAFSGTANKGTTSYYDYTSSGYGITAGYDLPFRLRVFAGYGLSNEYEFTYTHGSNKVKGTYTKVGISIAPFRLLSINAEYIMNNLNKYDSGTGYEDMVNYYSRYVYNKYLVSISVPFNL